MDRLKGLRCMLSGGIDRVVDDGVGWRNKIKKKTEEAGINIIFFDPCDKPKGLGSEIGIEKNKVKELIEKDCWDEAKKFVKTFRHYDLRAVDHCDFVIVKIDINSHLCGTYDEVFLAERQLKPIFVIMGEDQSKYDIPTWMISFINEKEIFESEEECVEYLLKLNRGDEKFDERWVNWGY